MFNQNTFLSSPSAGPFFLPHQLNQSTPTAYPKIVHFISTITTQSNLSLLQNINHVMWFPVQNPLMAFHHTWTKTHPSYCGLWGRTWLDSCLHFKPQPTLLFIILLLSPFTAFALMFSELRKLFPQGSAWMSPSHHSGLSSKESRPLPPTAETALNYSCMNTCTCVVHHCLESLRLSAGFLVYCLSSLTKMQVLWEQRPCKTVPWFQNYVWYIVVNIERGRE